MDKILELPFEFQAMLVAGYLAYRVSVVGVDKNIRAQDQFFQILVYGFIGLIASQILHKFVNDNRLWTISVILAVPFVSSCIWRGFGHDRFFKLMRFTKVHSSYSQDSTLDTIQYEFGKLPRRYVAIRLKDGRWLKSDLGKVMEANPPSKPFILDGEGNVAVYVTNVWSEKDGAKVVEFEDDGTFEYTYIPHAEIKEMDIGWRKK